MLESLHDNFNAHLFSNLCFILLIIIFVAYISWHDFLNTNIDIILIHLNYPPTFSLTKPLLYHINSELEITVIS